MSTYIETISSGEYVELPGGSSFQILSCSSSVDLEFRLNGQNVGEARQVGTSYYSHQYETDRKFDQVKITASYGSVEIKVDISDANTGTNVLFVSNDVTVIDSAKARLKEGKAFNGYTATAPVGSEYAYAEMYNPPGNDKNIIVERADCFGVAASSSRFMGFNMHSSSLSGLSGFSSEVNRLAGDTNVSGVEFRSENDGTPKEFDFFICNRIVENSDLLGSELVGDILLPPGFGLIAYSTGIGEGVRAFFQYYYEDII